MCLLCASESQSVSADALSRLGETADRRHGALLGLPRFAKLNARRRSLLHERIVRRLAGAHH